MRVVLKRRNGIVSNGNGSDPIDTIAPGHRAGPGPFSRASWIPAFCSFIHIVEYRQGASDVTGAGNGSGTRTQAGNETA